METRLYFQMLRRGWWIILLTTLTALAAALGFSYFTTPQYKAVARLIVSPSSSLVSRSDVVNSLDTLDRQSITTTFADVMNSSRVYNDALASLQRKPQDLKAYTFKAAVLPTSSVLELTATGPDPKLTADMANAIGVQTINFTRQLNQVYNVDFLDTAVPPPDPFTPQPLLYAGLAIVFGLIVGAVLAVLSEQLRIPLESLRQQLHSDEMTGVYNTKYFGRLVDEELAQTPDTVLSIGIIELNGLRDLVETLPITSLQNVFQRVTGILRNELRGNDVIGRWNDISFSILLPNTAGTAAKGIFERIFQALAQPLKIDQLDTIINFDTHIGAAENTDHLLSHDLFERANSALEESRRTGNVPVSVWETKTRSKANP